MPLPRADQLSFQPPFSSCVLQFTIYSEVIYNSGPVELALSSNKSAQHFLNCLLYFVKCLVTSEFTADLHHGSSPVCAEQGTVKILRTHTPVTPVDGRSSGLLAEMCGLNAAHLSLLNRDKLVHCMSALWLIDSQAWDYARTAGHYTVWCCIHQIVATVNAGLLQL